MEEEWISLQEFMRRYKIGKNVALQMIHNKEVECQMTPRRKIQNQSWWKYSK